MGFLQSGLIDPTDRAVIDFASQPLANHVVGGVTQASTDRRDRCKNPRVHSAASRDSSRNEQKGVARQKGHHNDPRFQEEDHEHDDVDEDAVFGGDRHQKAVGLRKQIEK